MSVDSIQIFFDVFDVFVNSYRFGYSFHFSDEGIAPSTQNTSHFARCMAVINDTSLVVSNKQVNSTATQSALVLLRFE
jgi:hypothetical protein